MHAKRVIERVCQRGYVKGWSERSGRHLHGERDPWNGRMEDVLEQQQHMLEREKDKG